MEAQDEVSYQFNIGHGRARSGFVASIDYLKLALHQVCLGTSSLPRSGPRTKYPVPTQPIPWIGTLVPALAAIRRLTRWVPGVVCTGICTMYYVETVQRRPEATPNPQLQTAESSTALVGGCSFPLCVTRASARPTFRLFFHLCPFGSCLLSIYPRNQSDGDRSGARCSNPPSFPSA